MIMSRLVRMLKCGEADATATYIKKFDHDFVLLFTILETFSMSNLFLLVLFMPRTFSVTVKRRKMVAGNGRSAIRTLRCHV